jgi:hypothetical protein
MRCYEECEGVSDDLERMRRVITSIDLARRYAAKAVAMGDIPGEDFDSDFIEVTALKAWNDNSVWVPGNDWNDK